MARRRMRWSLFVASVILSLLTNSCGFDGSNPTETSDLKSGTSSACRSDPSISWQYAPATVLNESVQKKAKLNLDTYVWNNGRHECTDLVTKALRDAGAKTRYNNPAGSVWPAVTSEDYQWGKFISSVPASSGFRQVPMIVTPGDIVQFRDAAFSYSYRVGNGTRTVTSHARHHSAVVSSVSADRKHFCVLEQNPDMVHYGWYPIAGMTNGTVWFYRPVRN